MPSRTLRLLVAAFCLAAMTTALALGGSYAVRLSDHRGILLVPIEDVVRTTAPRPRRTVVVVFDGLGRDDAATMPVMQALARDWPCLDMDVGAITFSRPSYAELSTGLESDRTGCRINDDRSPLAAESIWDVARQAGREVRIATELSWWHELFPRGIPEAPLLPRDADFFTPDRLGELTLIHPMYVDDAGHGHGVRSPEFQAALQRGDRELASLIALLDFSRDLLVVTGDHGHALRGGHGGREDRIAHVTTCFAGPGVARGPRTAEVSSTTIAPAIALLSGLRFPRHMRASSDGRDDLDVVMSLADPRAFPPDYLADRRAAIARFRGGNPAWSGIYEGERQKQTAGIALTVLVALVVVGAAVRRRSRAEIIAASCFVAGLYGATLVAIRVVHQGFDLSAITGTTAAFVRVTLLTCFAVASLAVALHVRLRRDLASLSSDLAVASAFGLVLTIAEPLVYGFRMGFPLPSAQMLFFPVVQTMMLAVHALMGVIVALVVAFRKAAREAPAPSS
jgi:hypothetical protein